MAIKTPPEATFPQESSISPPPLGKDTGETHATGANATHADYSLRASGSTYIERAKEAQEIIDRIKTSSASVIGIAGVRGAGKSSLAKKVLNECNAFGFFTLLIPSPTEYDPKDFLLAIFQRIAEHATERVQTFIEGAESLSELGDFQARRLRTQLFAIFGALILLGLLGGAGAYWAYEFSTAAQLKDLGDKQGVLTDEQVKRIGKPALVTPLPVTSPKDKNAAAAAASAHEQHLSSSEISNMIAYDQQTFRLTVTQLNDNTALTEIGHALTDKIKTLKVNQTYLTFLVVSGAIGSLSLLGLMAVILLLLKIWRKLRILKKHRIKVGLRSKCRAFEELIKYQSVLASGKEFALAPKFVSFLSGKFSSNKQLEDRPPFVTRPHRNLQCISSKRRGGILGQSRHLHRRT
ncbi:hypothetical protein UP09_22790 [Bradyrhizobium sp. LTSP885]|nr:hypothetical protein UP09_22790 [Bradyrhizobium sp. LTSP885]